MSAAPLVVTMGDACGIGPEIIAMAHARGELTDAVVIGDVDVMRRAAALVSSKLVVAGVSALPQVREVVSGALVVLPPDGLPSGLATLPYGIVDARAGAAAARCIRAGAALAMSGAACALVTAPIHKEALAASGEPFPGHTEMLQAESGGPAVRMMLANVELKTVLVSIHVALREAIEAVRCESVLETIRIAHAAAGRWGCAAPRIAVAGLNPHAGEGGLFGDEEVRHIAPAVAAAMAAGITASGPHAPDTVFMRARRGEFDLVVAMYHDQGLIPVKYLGVEEGVNVTLGLPFVRTSPDHGTAFDLAGRGRADPASLIAAVRMARRLAGEA